MNKKVFIGIDVLLILLSITPIGLLIYDCVNKAINGILPWGDGYGLDYGSRIYGLEAFRYELRFDLYWGGIFLGIPVAIIWFTTIIVTIITIVVCKQK